MTYRLAHTFNFNAINADTAGQELARIAATHGALRPAVVVDEARPADAPLHPAFEWHDGKAAEQWRRQQARSLISAVRIVEPERPEPSVAFVSVKADDGAQAYRSGIEVATDSDLYARAIRDAVEHLEAALRRLEAIQRLGTPPKEAIRAKRRVAAALKELRT